jgi:hypothetical protein
MKLAATAILALAAASAAVGQQPESGTFTLTQNGATIATETFERSARVLETELTVVNQATLQTHATLRPDATVGRLAVSVFGPGGATGEPVQTSAVRFENGTATFEQPVGTPAGEPTEVDAGAVPYVNPSPSFMEQILRRARAMGGDSVAVPVWTPGPGGGRMTTATVVFAERTATLTLGPVAIEATTDAVGRLLSARVPAQALVIAREQRGSGA